VYAACAPEDLNNTSPGAEQGAHEVVMRATLPGTDIALETAAVTIEVRCDADRADDEGGCSASGRGGSAGSVWLALVALVASSLRRRLIARPRTCDQA
jgi:uncharacterized protein (TIGR03382 family)